MEMEREKDVRGSADLYLKADAWEGRAETFGEKAGEVLEKAKKRTLENPVTTILASLGIGWWLGRKAAARSYRKLERRKMRERIFGV